MTSESPPEFESHPPRPRRPHNSEQRIETEDAETESETWRNEEHATILPPLEWYARWQDDKIKWEAERRRWQKAHVGRRSSSSPTTPHRRRSPAASQGPAVPEAALLSAPKREAGWRTRLWERGSGRAAIAHLPPADSHPIPIPIPHTRRENAIRDVTPPPTCCTDDAKAG